MQKVLSIIATLAAAAVVATAAPVNCPSDTTLAGLIATDSGGGCIIQDKLFSNFAYSGGGSVTASMVDSTLVFQPGANSQDIHGWIFAPVGGPWTTTFTISYDVAIAPGMSGIAIIAAKDQINSGRLPNGVVMTDTETGGALVAKGALGQETAQISVGNETSLHTSSTVTFGTSGDVLQSYEQDWFETAVAAVPEPLSLSLIGGGLLLLGLRRFRKA